MRLSLAGLHGASAGGVTRRAVAAACLLVPLAATGCSVPPTHLGRDAKELESALSSLDSAYSRDDEAALPSLVEKVSKLADALAAKTFLGDPRRELAEKAAARARDIRERLDARASLAQAASRKMTLEASAKAALQEAATSTAQVAGPPEGFELPTVEPETPAEKPAAKAAQAAPAVSADADLDRVARRAAGDKEGDVSDEPERKKSDAPKPSAADAAPGEIEITEATPPVVIQAVKTKGKAILGYFVFVNKSAKGVRIGSVVGDFLDARGKSVARINMTFEAKEFEPKWDDIFSSKGTPVTGESVFVQANQGVRLVAVGESSGGKAVAARIEVTTTDGKIHVGETRQ